MTPGSGKIPTFLGLGDFVAVRTLGGGLHDTLGRSSKGALKHAATRSCRGRQFYFDSNRGRAVEVV